MSKKSKLRITCAAQDGVAHIGISGHIYSESTNASSAALSKQLKTVSKNASKAVVRIHTPGGDVFEAAEIYNLIDDSFEDVQIIAGALVASAGTYFLTKWPSTAKANSMFMIHKPSGGAWGNEDDLESRLGLLKTLTADYRSSYAAKMDITEDEVDALWEKGDHWLTAKEALAAGLIDEIEKKKAAITPESYMDMVACGCPSAEQYKPKINTQDMNLAKTAQLVGLPESATEAEVTAKIKELQQSQGAPSEIQEAVDKVTAMHEATIKKYLDGAEASKKINAEQRKSFETLATIDFPKVTAIIDAMPEGGAPISEQLQGKKPKPEEERTYAWYQQNPKAWAELEANDPEKAEALAEAHYEEA